MKNVKTWGLNILKGMAIGIACIVPGVSGGTLAVILNVYDKIIESISNLRKHFIKSLSYLWPIILGIILGLVAMVYPLKKALEYFPFPTIMLFVGFILGSFPSLFDNVKKELKPIGIVPFIISIAVPIVLCFISSGRDVNLSNTMEVYMYFVIILVGIVASCALSVPGISGSMLLMILGFFNPILNLLTDLLNFNNVLFNLLILGLFGIGVIIGFFLISKLMNFLLKKYKYMTYMAINGLVVGSIFAIFYSTKDTLFQSNFNLLTHISLGVILFIVGVLISLWIYFYSKKKMKNTTPPTNEDIKEENIEVDEQSETR